MAVKDGLPSTDFSRMNREWVKSVANEGGVGLPPVTEADNGKILGVVNGAWGAMDAGGGGGDESPIQMAPVTFNIESEGGIKAVLFQAEIEYPSNPSEPYTAFFTFGDADNPGTAPDIDSTITFDLPTYNGIGYIFSTITGAVSDGSVVSPTNISLSGNAERDEKGIKVTGECTITITWGT